MILLVVWTRENYVISFNHNSESISSWLQGANVWMERKAIATQMQPKSERGMIILFQTYSINPFLLPSLGNWVLITNLQKFNQAGKFHTYMLLNNSTNSCIWHYGSANNCLTRGAKQQNFVQNQLQWAKSTTEHLIKWHKRFHNKENSE